MKKKKKEFEDDATAAQIYEPLNPEEQLPSNAMAKHVIVPPESK